MGTFVLIALELAAIIIAAWRGRILATPRTQKLAFAALGLASVVLIGVQSWRLASAKRQAERQAQVTARALAKAQDDVNQARIESQQYERRVSGLATQAAPSSPNPASPAANLAGTTPTPSGPPRVLTAEQKTDLVKLLKKTGRHGIVVRYAKDNDEAQHYADSIASALRDAGWTFRPPKFILWDQEPRGMVIMVSDLTAVPRDADDFVLALNKVGIQVKWLEQSSLDAGAFELMVGAQ